MSVFVGRRCHASQGGYAAAAVSVLASRIQIKGGQVATRWLLTVKSRGLINLL